MKDSILQTHMSGWFGLLAILSRSQRMLIYYEILQCFSLEVAKTKASQYNPLGLIVVVLQKRQSRIALAREVEDMKSGLACLEVSSQLTHILEPQQHPSLKPVHHENYHCPHHLHHPSRSRSHCRRNKLPTRKLLHHRPNLGKRKRRLVPHVSRLQRLRWQTWSFSRLFLPFRNKIRLCKWTGKPEV
jgi:hypothetical protein